MREEYCFDALVIVRWYLHFGGTIWYCQTSFSF